MPPLQAVKTFFVYTVFFPLPKIIVPHKHGQLLNEHVYLSQHTWCACPIAKMPRGSRTSWEWHELYMIAPWAASWKLRELNSSAFLEECEILISTCIKILPRIWGKVDSSWLMVYCFHQGWLQLASALQAIMLVKMLETISSLRSHVSFFIRLKDSTQRIQQCQKTLSLVLVLLRLKLESMVIVALTELTYWFLLIAFFLQSPLHLVGTQQPMAPLRVQYKCRKWKLSSASLPSFASYPWRDGWMDHWSASLSYMFR